MNLHRRTSWLVRGVGSLCFLLVLMGITVPSAFASAHTQSTTATSTDLNPSFRIKHVVELGTFDFGGITMINDKVGWTFTGKVQRTSDGGKTWQTVAQGNAQEYIGAVEVLDENITWYLSYNAQTYAPAALYRTTNGGKTWTRFAWIDPTQSMERISILDGQAAWVDTYDSNGLSHIYLVGGSNQNWQAVTSPGPNAANTIFFISEKVGWATVVTPGNFNSTWTLYATRDGGQTWVPQNLPVPAGVPAGAVATNIQFIGFGDQQEGYLKVFLGDTASYQQYASYIYRTTDGGRSWQPHGDPIPLDPNSNVEFISQIDQWHTPASWFASFVVNGQVGIGKLLGGKWQAQYITLPSNGYFLTVLTDREMFVSGYTADNTGQDLYKTLDGGATWQKITTVPN